MLARAAQAAIAERIEWHVLAFVLVIFFAGLLQDHLNFVIWKRRRQVLEVVFNHFVFPVVGVCFFKVNTNVE